MTPYALAADRVRALYRVPTAPARHRTLEICHRREPWLSSGARWPGEGHGLWRCDAVDGSRIATAGAPFPHRSFDLVILHHTLDDVAGSSASASSPDAAQVLREAVRVLVPGGLLVGSVANRHDPARWLGRLRGSSGRLPHFSAGRLRAALAAARLADVRVFNLLPDGDDPLRLVDTDPALSTLAFRRELDARRRHLSPPAYLARRAVVESGLSRHLEAALFFWGYRPC